MINIETDQKQMEGVLDKFEELCGFLSVSNKKTIELAQELLNLDWSEYKGKVPSLIALDACILSDYAFIVQKIINRQRSIVFWCKSRIRKLVGLEMPKYKAFSFEERESMAISAHPTAQSLFYKKTEAELYLTRIESLYQDIRNLSDKLNKLADTKLDEEKTNTVKVAHE